MTTTREEQMTEIAAEAFFQIEALCASLQRAITEEAEGLPHLFQAVLPRIYELADVMFETRMDSEPEDIAGRLRHEF